ncbi:MAG: AAA family ATPase [Actinobacteria bacterium]|nr:AAA family ATPase [Actinomycetota bacterium]
MHLKRITLRGFKSFPDRTRLDFAPGVSVIVGPNGSGKSNITDGVLWALGEQSPLAVRGQTMQDVIFAGGHGVSSRSAAEVEVVIDNPAGTLEGGFSEIAIARRLDRDGESEYRLNGARCRLVDVLEALSDTGLGREMHSVVSQGRVEAIVHSKPRDRRLLIEEAAGLGKHRKRRRRAQLKLERTEDNVARVLDVEREARSRLRPLKRQAEAAELHERLRTQQLEARLELVRDACGRSLRDLAGAEAASSEARSARDALEGRLAAVSDRREAAEQAFAAHARSREALSARGFGARSAGERIAIRLERAEEVARRAAAAADRLRREHQLLAADGRDGIAPPQASRLRRAEELDSALDACRRELEEADAAVEGARRDRIAADREAEEAAARAAAAGADLAAAQRFVATAQGPAGDHPAVASELAVEPGCEMAVAAALGGLAAAALVRSRGEAEAVLDEASDRGGSALVVGGGLQPSARAVPPPVPGARPLLDCVRTSRALGSALSRVLHDAWLVRSLDALPDSFRGVAATADGRAYFAATGELRRAPAGGEGRLLAETARLERLRASAMEAEGQQRDADRAAAGAREAAGAAIDRRDRAEGALRSVQRDRAAAADSLHRTDWLVERRARRLAALERGASAQADVAAAADRAESALRTALDAVNARRHAAERELAAGEQRGESTAAELRACAREEAEIQASLREAADAVTSAEVRAQQARDAAGEVESERAALVAALRREEGEPAVQARDDDLGDERRADLEARVERLARRREQLGPVNPLAAQEYEEAVAHVEELERQRGDLESAIGELRGLIRETDRRIRQSFDETFEAAARSFEDVVGHLFPGGRGRLRLVQPEGPRPVLGGRSEDADDADLDGAAVAGDEGPATAGATAAGDDEAAPAPTDPGVEIEVTPAGKSAKRLSLMSGGEKSLVALAFLFAVFLARPCPFYILDEVEAALDDANIDRFLELLRRYCDRAQFIVVTHQKRTMDAADCLYGVSMGGDGVSKVVSRRLPPPDGEHGEHDDHDDQGERRGRRFERAPARADEGVQAA